MSLIIPANSASVAGGFSIDNSCRFDNAYSGTGASDYLTRTYSAGNRRTFTISFWIKRSGLFVSQWQQVLGQYDVGADQLFRVGYNSSEQGDVIRCYGAPGGFEFRTTALYRDVSAWYHVVLAIDTTQGTEANRAKLYVNGTQVTSFVTANYPGQNVDQAWNIAALHKIAAGTSSGPFCGYLAQVVNIDGAALAPTSFGEFDEDSGIWKPIDVSELTFGTNGFFLDFADSGDLGDDESGNGNDFAETGIAAINQVTDTPTNNFCTLSPLADSTSILSDGNCVNNADTSQTTSKGSIAVSNGRWYTECKITTSNQYPMLGIWSVETTAFQNPTDTSYPGQVTPSYGGYGNGSIYANGSNTGSQSFTWGNGNIIGIYLDLESSTKTIKWYKDGSSIATLDLATTTDAFVFGDYNSANALTASWNFGNPAFAISSGNTDANGYGNFEFSPTIGGVDYFAICTKNLAEHG